MTTQLFPLLLSVSLLIGMWICERRSPHPAKARWTYLVGVLTGVAGSRLWYFLQYGDPSLRGGLSSWGFMIGATLGCSVWLRLSSGRWAFREFGCFADAVAPAIAFGSVLTRVGCFYAGCNFGKPTDLLWGVSYGRGTLAFNKQIQAGLIDPAAAWSLPVHPTQLYESAALLLALLLILWSPKRLFSRVLAGELFLGLAIYYGTFRFFVEFLRDDAGGVRFGALTFAQATSGIVVLISVVAILHGRRQILTNLVRNLTTSVVKKNCRGEPVACPAQGNTLGMTRPLGLKNPTKVQRTQRTDGRGSDNLAGDAHG